MKWLWIIISLLLVSNSAWAQRYVEGEVIVRLKGQDGPAKAYQFLGKAQMEKGMRLRRSWKNLNMYHFKIKPGQSVEEIIQDLKMDPDVAYVEPNYILEKAGNELHGKLSSVEVFNMSSQSAQYSTDVNIGLQNVVGSIANISKKPIIAVIDTGLDMTHPVFTQSNAIWTNEGEVPGNGIDDDGNGYVDDIHGWNYVANSGVIIDDDDHGTHVAGAILSVGLDIFSNPVSESPVKIMPLKFLDGNGVGTTSDAIDAIDYAIKNGATVLNNSWGGDSYSTALHEAVVRSYESGAAFVAAAGNLGTNNDQAPIYPASYDVPNIISVAATMNNDSLAEFSNYGYNTVHIGSPGVYILSTIGGGSYGYMSGTSMASPLVAGVAALMKVYAGDMKGFQIKSIIEQTAQGTSQLSGRVSAEARLKASTSIELAKVAQVSESQPSYSLQGGRSGASEMAGCGVVTKMAFDSTKGPGSKGGGTGLLFKLLAGILFLAPLAFMLVARARSPRDNRKHDRFKIDSDVRMQIGEKTLVGSVSSISLGGVQVNTDAMLDQGGIITMSISSPDGKEQVQVKGKVVWSQEREAYGVKFEQAPSNVLNSISGWTRALIKT